VQPEKLPECPEGLIDNGSVCYTLTPKSSFPPDCPFNNLMSFPLYKDIIIDKKIAPVWMPVRRNVTDGLEFLQWIEQSTLYKTDFNGTIFYEGEIKGKDCLLYYNNSYMVAVSCDEKHSAFVLMINRICGAISCAVLQTASKAFSLQNPHVSMRDIIQNLVQKQSLLNHIRTMSLVG
jgi:hypothetical protein